MKILLREVPDGASFSIGCGCVFRRRPEWKVRRHRQTVRVLWVGSCGAHSPANYLAVHDRMMNASQVEIDPLAMALDSTFN